MLCLVAGKGRKLSFMSAFGATGQLFGATGSYFRLHTLLAFEAANWVLSGSQGSVGAPWQSFEAPPEKY